MVLKELMMNKIFLAVLAAGVLTQLVKVVFYWSKHKKVTWSDLIVTGGMPSFHSAFTLSLLTIVYLVDGLTTSFFVSLVLAVIVVRDAFGVRRSVGEEGLLLNKIAKNLKMHKKLHYSTGHTPMEVFVGSVIGIAVSLAVFYL